MILFEVFEIKNKLSALKTDLNIDRVKVQNGSDFCTTININFLQDVNRHAVFLSNR